MKVLKSPKISMKISVTESLSKITSPYYLTSVKKDSIKGYFPDTFSEFFRTAIHRTIMSSCFTNVF